MIIFDYDGLKKQVKELEEKQLDPSLWNDIKKTAEIAQKLKSLSDRVDKITSIKTKVSDLVMLSEMYLDEDKIEQDSQIELQNELLEIEKLYLAIKLDALLSGEYDTHDAIVTLHAGAGGTEAQDWTSMLYRMYERFCLKRGYKITEEDSLPGDIVGYKSITFSVKGENAYGFLKAEKGVHRLVRISPFDSSAKRHTSFASLEVVPEIEDDKEIEIKSDDIRIDTYRSSGAGGQHVNKTESAIRITHFPSGIVVQCQNERSQTQNKERAITMLKSKLIELKEREREKEQSEIKGDLKKIEWGSQIRSYVFCPYTMVKDHRTNYQESDIQAVMNGNIDNFINEYLLRS